MTAPRDSADGGFWPVADRLTHWPPALPDPSTGWGEVVAVFWASEHGRSLLQAVQARLDAQATIYPPEPLRALTLTPLHAVRVVILGQDPYHGPGQAEGLAFSVAEGLKLPPSLRNMFKELQRDPSVNVGAAPTPTPGAEMPLASPWGAPRVAATAAAVRRDALPTNGSLRAWAERGVLLLNTCLTVEQGEAASHAGLGWEVLTDALVDAVAAQAPACVWMLWGAHAQSKRERIERQVAAHGHAALILAANHPSPLSASRPPVPFIGCGHFGQAQAWWAQRGVTLDWRLP